MVLQVQFENKIRKGSPQTKIYDCFELQTVTLVPHQTESLQGAAGVTVSHQRFIVNASPCRQSLCQGWTRDVEAETRPRRDAADTSQNRDVETETTTPHHSLVSTDKVCRTQVQSYRYYLYTFYFSYYTRQTQLNIEFYVVYQIITLLQAKIKSNL